MKNSIPQGQVIWVRHWSNLHEFTHVIAVIYAYCVNKTCYVDKLNSWFIRIQVNQNNGYQIMPFKEIILAFVYFWQVIFFWAVMLNITESNIKNISQTLSKSRQQFSKNSWAGNSCIFNSVLSNSILLWNSRKLRLRADAQPWIFQDRGCFLKCAPKNCIARKKGSTGKN